MCQSIQSLAQPVVETEILQPEERVELLKQFPTEVMKMRRISRRIKQSQDLSRDRSGAPLRLGMINILNGSHPCAPKARRHSDPVCFDMARASIKCQRKAPQGAFLDLTIHYSRSLRVLRLGNSLFRATSQWLIYPSCPAPPCGQVCQLLSPRRSRHRGRLARGPCQSGIQGKSGSSRQQRLPTAISSRIR